MFSLSPFSLADRSAFLTQKVDSHTVDITENFTFHNYMYMYIEWTLGDKVFNFILCIAQFESNLFKFTESLVGLGEICGC